MKKNNNRGWSTQTTRGKEMQTKSVTDTMPKRKKGKINKQWHTQSAWERKIKLVQKETIKTTTLVETKKAFETTKLGNNQSARMLRVNASDAVSTLLHTTTTTYWRMTTTCVWLLFGWYQYSVQYHDFAWVELVRCRSIRAVIAENQWTKWTLFFLSRTFPFNN